MKRAFSILIFLAGICVVRSGAQTDIYVPGQYATIQAAVDAASPGAVIHLAAGKYPEILTINKSLTITGTGTNDCVIYNYETNEVPLISITGPATVTLSGFKLVGGAYQSWYTNSEWYQGFSPLGIVSTNATLTMNSVVVNQIVNFFVTVTGGSLCATNVALWTEDLQNGADVGFQLNSCVARFDGLTQDTGHIDHTININNPPATFSDVTVANSRIRASRGSYGNCIRTYVNSRLLVTNCWLYRGTTSVESAVPFASGLQHNAVSENGYSNTVIVTGNMFANLPWAIGCYGSLGGNQISIENNVFSNSLYGGVWLDSMWYDGVDLGGGALGSQGENVFSESPAVATNYVADVFYTNTSAYHPLANTFALHNMWSNPTDKELVIIDKLDNPDYGRVISDDLVIKLAGKDAAGRPVLTWNERGAGEQYTIQTSADLTAGDWTNAPGSWPVSNPTLNGMTWTNPVAVSSMVFYRLRSVVP
jgi:hypothetical protein